MSLLSARARKSLADVIRRPGRSLLLVTGIFIGVFGLTAINTTESSILASFAYASGYHASQPDITLSVDRLDPALLGSLQKQPNVAAVQYQAIYRTYWEVGGQAGRIPLAIQSFPDLANVPLRPFQLTQGRLPSTGEIMLDFNDQQAHPYRTGDIITIATARGAGRLRVVGMTSTAGFSGGDTALGYMSASALARIAGEIGVNSGAGAKPSFPSLLNVINIKVRDASAKNATQAALTALLAAHQIQIYVAAQPGVSANARLVEKTIGGLFTLLRALVGLAVLMSALLILGAVTTLLTEQAPIIGAMKAMGGTRGVIARGYLVSVTLMALLASVTGIPLGALAGYQLALTLAPRIPLALAPYTADPAQIALSLVVGLLVPSVAALIPIWNAARMPAQRALAGHGERVGAQVAMPGPIWLQFPWLSQVTLLGARGAFRKRWRAALTVTTLAVAGACFLVTQTAVTSLDQTVAASTATASTDITVRFHDIAAYTKVSAQLAALPNVARVEVTASGNLTTAWGTLALSGYAPDTQLYHDQLTGGRWLRDEDTEVILLSDDAARKMGLHVGDTLTVGGRTLTVIGTIHQTISVLGWIGAAVTTAPTADALIGSSAGAGGIAEVSVAASDRSQAAISQLAARISALANPSGASSDGQGYFSGAGATVDTIHEYTTRRQGTWYILYALLYGVALLVGVAGAVALANTLVSSVVDRQREIGILRAMGASGAQIARVFWIEGVAQGGLAWLIGGMVGAPAAYAFVQVIWQVAMPLDFHLDPLAFAVALAAILAVASLASVAPAWRASHARTATLLRYE